MDCESDLVTPLGLSLHLYTPWIEIMDECLVWGTDYEFLYFRVFNGFPHLRQVWGHAPMVCTHGLTLILGRQFGGLGWVLWNNLSNASDSIKPNSLRDSVAGHKHQIPVKTAK
jgi:hypothetical protein